MADRGRLPDALFVRHPEAERDQGLPLVGLLCLLTSTADPEAMARHLVPQFVPVDEIPLDGAVVPLWTDEADVWPCDLQARVEAQARLAGAAVVVVARTESDGFVYHQLAEDVAADVCDMLAEAMREGVN